MNEFNFKEWLLGLWNKTKALPWKRIGLICLCVFLALVLTGMIVVTVFVENLLNSIIIIPPDETLPPDATGVDSTYPTEPSIPSIPGVSEPTAPKDIIAHEDLVNIMLVGQDRREGQTTGRTLSDVMILCTFNKQDKTITMTSFLRDLYVNIDGNMDKMNQAYFRGGTDLLKQTMLDNFGVQVDYFVEVDFSSFKNIINALDGVDIYLTAEEAEYMNTYILDGIHYEAGSLTAGMNHLDGDQALEYARIRYVGGTGDFGRTERQRNVLNAIINKCKTMDLTTAQKLLDAVLPHVRTDIPSKTEILNLAWELFPLLSGDIRQQRIPLDNTWEAVNVPIGSYTVEVIVPDFELNHQFLVDSLMPD